MTKTIEKINRDGSAVLLQDEPQQEEVAFAMLLAEYKLSSDSSVQWLDTQARQLSKCNVHKELVRKHAAMLAIQGAFETHPIMAGSLTIRAKPSLSVQASRKFKVRQLKMVPVCYSFRNVPDITGFQCVVKEDTAEHIFTLARPPKHKAVPAFFVARCEHEDDANMELTLFKATVSTGSKAKQYQIDVPMLQNSRELEDGDELLLPPLNPTADGVPQSQKRISAIVVDDGNAAAKKQRQAE